MLSEQYEKLMKAASENAYMSIAINENGEHVTRGFVPWERTTSAFNMRTPKITLAASDLQNDSIMEALNKCRMIGCYIFTPLTDYSFISGFTELMDLFILCGENIQDLSFVRDLPELFMFYLEDASLPDVKPLTDAFDKGDRIPGKCIGFYHCDVADTSALAEADFIISELLIWPVAGDTAERWKPVKRSCTFRFYGEKK
jgi:hypothetical protein